MQDPGDVQPPQSYQMTPLEDRICINFATHGVNSADGSFKLCIGKICSRYEVCLSEMYESAFSLNSIHQEMTKEIKRYL